MTTTRAHRDPLVIELLGGIPCRCSWKAGLFMTNRKEEQKREICGFRSVQGLEGAGGAVRHYARTPCAAVT